MGEYSSSDAAAAFVYPHTPNVPVVHADSAKSPANPAHSAPKT
jgi:hypothetical protein